MSILLKNLDMPKEDELLCVTICPGGKVCISLDLECKQVGTAVQVPTPHGDLIDRNKLREKEFIHDGDAYAVVMSRDIRNAPTIIEAEEVYNKYTDTAGNLHWTGTRSGEHTIRAEEEKGQT